ncbi:MAG: cobyrinate a,c-diamide synthase [Lachnospiraceae bacterium]|nr:cobyrinate a,c-diamide synthase [Lachnospiraceae bacterium]
MKLDRIMIAAPASGSGKTLITCGLLGLLKRKGYQVGSFKCGPDFIDPMFHTRVIGTKSRNLDTFFTDHETTRSLLAKNAADCDIAVMEGVMGYFDGMGLNDSRAGASDLAQVTDTPVLLIVNAKGCSRSILPAIKGFLDFQEKPCIKGIILNRVSPMLYPRMKEMIESELDTRVVGYVPVLTDCVLESRHLGLMMPDEIEDLRGKLDRLASELEQSLDLEAILQLAGEAPELPESRLIFGETSKTPVQEPISEDHRAGNSLESDKPAEHAFRERVRSRGIRIGLARDEAFCFMYEDNLTLLREMGAELIEFSPIHDRQLPENLDGLLFHGGYPELYTKELSENTSMRQSIKTALDDGMICMAECGGFLYLHEELEDTEGQAWPMVGAVPGKAWYTGKLQRFGYITLSGGRLFGKDVGDIRSHEFHYYDSPCNGEEYLAQKPAAKRSWRCENSGDTLFCGFPHLYYYANPLIPKAFLERILDHPER